MHLNGIPAYFDYKNRERFFLNRFHLDIHGQPPLNLRKLLYDLGEYENKIAEDHRFITSFKYDRYTEPVQYCSRIGVQFFAKIHKFAQHHQWEQFGKICALEPNLRHIHKYRKLEKLVRSNEKTTTSIMNSKMQRWKCVAVVAPMYLNAVLQRAVVSRVSSVAKGHYALQHALHFTNVVHQVDAKSNMMAELIFAAAMTLFAWNELDIVEKLLDVRKCGIAWKQNMKYIHAILLLHEYFSNKRTHNPHEAKELANRLMDCAKEFGMEPQASILVESAIRLLASSGNLDDETELLNLIDSMMDKSWLLDVLITTLKCFDLEQNVEEAVKEVLPLHKPNLHCADELWVFWAESMVQRNDVQATLEVIQAMFLFLDYSENRKNWRAWKVFHRALKVTDSEHWADFWTERSIWWPTFHQSIDQEESDGARFRVDVMELLLEIQLPNNT